VIDSKFKHSGSSEIPYLLRSGEARLAFVVDDGNAELLGDIGVSSLAATAADATVRPDRTFTVAFTLLLLTVVTGGLAGVIED